MGRHTLEGNPPIDVILRRSARAKRMSLRLSRLDGRVILTLPPHARDREGVAFLSEREAWLREHLADVAPVIPVGLGGDVMFEGRSHPIIAATSGRARLEAGNFLVTDPARAATQVKAILRIAARDRLAAASDAYATQLGRQYARLSLRDTRSRWGSCSSAGVLMYSWRLIMAPPEILNYVAAHEVAHLVEMNHSDAFWAVVAGLDPDYQPKRRWLRENGDQLHRYQFDD
ncbi:M48 family metallopeptidase [Yoonia sp. SS1-5]|uniref:M48 family metallopeptidase n=1 Tax=Yoonia rhodophyticola TaxID=3137370 RepID=A0AAN0NLP8_9RHOB